MATRPRFLIGNWKQNGSLAANATLLSAVKAGVAPAENRTCAVAVPSPYLQQAREALAGSSIAVASQDVSCHDFGAFTGEVGASMVADLGAKYALVGHSERRTLFGDADLTVAQKFIRAKTAGLTPVLCVGETLAEREAGSTQHVVVRQLLMVVASCGADTLKDAILAYEPVWAIGTGKTATPEEADAVHVMLRNEIRKWDATRADTVSILYGGSVKKSNAKELFAMPNIDGGLIGGASLSAQEFLGIWAAL